MTRTRFLSIGALPLALALVACGGDKLLPVGHHLPAETACGDGFDNDRDGFVDCADLDCRVAGGSCTLAPPLDRSVATTTAEAAAFLYTGSDPLQKGADPKAFDARRVAMVRGKVVGVDRQPLAGVKISIVDHPEYGSTQSRGDGLFDMAVNGGARVLVRYEFDGYLLAERASNPGWQRYARVPEVGLVARSENQSRLRLETGSYEVALGDEVADANGTRQPFVFFQSGTSATAELPNGDQQKLKDVTLSVTEYPFERTTADDYVSTARFAPGTLPLSGGLHYGLEFSIAEAEKLAARRVTLSDPAVIYVENFLGLPVGSPVPLGYYDPRAGQWQGATGGRVVRILDIDAGRAVLDLDGDGAPDDEHALTLAKVSNEERLALGSHYAKDATLWRASVKHFSSWDMQFPVRPPADAVGPTSRLAFARSLDQPTRRGPSVVERMALSQSVPLTGTPYSLSYQSDRSSAYGSGFQFQLPLLGDEVPPGLKRVISSVEIAGQQLTVTHEPTANLTRTVLWDGKDGFDRLVQGPQLAHVAVSFVFDGSLEVSDTFGVSGSDEADAAVTAALDAGDAVISQDFDVPLGVWDAKGYELGGFALDVLHAYDPASQAVYFGWGDERTAQNIALVVTRPGSEFELGTPDSIGPAANGSLFVTDDDQNSANPAGRVLEIDPDGQVFVVAGAGASGAAGELTLDSPQGVVVKGDGTLLVADLQNDAVREIRPDGSVRTLLGDSSENPVVEAELSHVDGIALGPREELYVVDTGRVLRVEGSSVSVFAGGNASDGSSNVGDGGPARKAVLVGPSGVAAAPDGTVFISERGSDDAPGGHRIRKVSPNGTITTVVGRGQPGFSGDGGDGQLGELHSPRGLALAPGGSLYIADQGNNRIRRLTTDGILQTIVGGGDAKLEEGQLAERVQLDAPDGIAVDRQGVLYIGAGESVYRVAPGKPELKSTEALVPSTDGRTLYRFDARGRHEETIDAMTGVTELTLAYDAAGHLATLKDKNGLTTSIERDGNGAPKAIVSPFQQRTELELDADGAISKVTDPLGRTRQFGFEDGRLRRAFDPAQGEHVFDYQDLGLLKSVTEPNGYAETLEPQSASDGFSVLVSEPTGVATEYGLGFDAAGTLKRRVKYPTGNVVSWDDVIVSTTRKNSDGSSVTTRFLPDDAFGAQALFPSEVSLKTPSGKVLTSLGLRGKRLTDIDNRLSVEEWIEQLEVNGKTTENLYIAKERSLTHITPTGRKHTTILDERGRPTDLNAKGLPSVHLDYDDSGHVARITAAADQQDRIAEYTYGDDGFLKTATAPDKTAVTYGRDLVGRVTRLLRPDGETVETEFDENDNLVSLTPPGRGAHVFDFGGSRNLLALSTPPAASGDPARNFQVGQTKYGYTKDLDLESVAGSDGRTTHFGYDKKGLLTSITLTAANLGFGYDSNGEISSARRSDGATVTLTHDGSLWTGATWSGPVEGSVSASYDDDFRLATLTVNDSLSSKYEYDADGLVTSATANGVALTLTRNADTGFVDSTTLGKITTSNAYNGFGELSALSANFQNTTDFSQKLERDALGRVSKIVESFGTEQHELRYEYDEVGRLKKATRDGSATSYSYDQNGNRTQLQSEDEDLAGKYDGQDRLLSFGAFNVEQTVKGDLFRASDDLGAIELSYDEVGNLLAATLSDAEDAIKVSYVMDGLGHRVARQVNGSFDRAWLYDSSRPVAEIDSAGNFLHFIYTNATDIAPDYILRAGVPLRVIKDHVGSVRLIVNAQSGVVEQKLGYDEFGRVFEDSRPGFQPFGFAGGFHDPDTGLVRFGARDYSPKLGRWVSKDPVGFKGGDTNLYAYCGNDPVNKVDPTGNEAGTITVLAGCVSAPAACAVAVAAGAVLIGVAGHQLGKALDKVLADAKIEPNVPTRPARYTIMSGVRRAKAAQLMGRPTVRALDLSTGQIIDLPIDALLSPKPVIELEGQGLDRWHDALRDVQLGTYPPIEVQPGNYGIPLRAVEVR